MQVDETLIRKYHEGECTKEEKAAVEKWLSIHSADDVPPFPERVNAFNAEVRIWGKLQNFITTRQKRSKTLYLTASAACVTLLAVAILIYDGSSNDSSSRESTVTKIQYKTIQTPHGKRSEFTLPDGTEVHLNAGSELKFPLSFSGKDRTIFLKGEAFLKVFKDSAHPFIVSTPKTQVRVLGTAFNIRDYADSSFPVVIVQEGKVRFSSSQDEVHLTLTADQMGTLAPDSKMEKSNTNAARHLLWTSNTLDFNDESIEAVVQKLERWFDITVEVKDAAVKKMRFTGQFKQTTAEETLKKIAFVLNRKLTVAGKNFIIH